MRYAQNTAVSADRSRGEIEATLVRYGATGFQYGWLGTQAAIQFAMHDKVLLFKLPLPDRGEDEFRFKIDGRSGSKKELTSDQTYKIWEQATRQRWRALLLAVKAKLEAVECRITTFEEEFMAHIVIPGTKQTIGSQVLPQIEEAYLSGKKPTLMLDWK